MLIELEAPDVDTKMKTESLVDSRVGGVGRERGMSSYLDVREPNHQLHQQVRVLPFVSARRAVGSPG